MKTLLAIALFTISLTTFAAGGTTKNFVTFLYGASEDEVLAQAKALIPQIQNGKNATSRREMEDAGCEVKPRNIRIGGLAIYGSYSGPELKQQFVGRLDYSNSDCESND